jgi:hypothetical protein
LIKIDKFVIQFEDPYNNYYATLIIAISDFFFGDLQPDCTKNNEVAPCLWNQNIQKMDEEAKPTPKNSKTWMKLLNLDENIAYEWM